MMFARLTVKNATGFKTHWISYQNEAVCGRYLQRFHAGKETELRELNPREVNIAKFGLLIEFKEIK